MPDGPAGVSLVTKLGIKPGYRVLLVGAPRGWDIEGMPAGSTSHRAQRGATPRAGSADVVVAFFSDLATHRATVPRLVPAIGTTGSLWVAWPRRAGGHSSDITDNAVRGSVFEHGLVDVKVAALDQDWSALKMVVRLERRDPAFVRRSTRRDRGEERR